MTGSSATSSARDGFPADRYGLTAPQRLELALTGLALDPARRARGSRCSSAATLPDGSPAFERRELRHMADVRRLLGMALQGPARRSCDPRSSLARRAASLAALAHRRAARAAARLARDARRSPRSRCRSSCSASTASSWASTRSSSAATAGASRRPTPCCGSTRRRSGSDTAQLAAAIVVAQAIVVALARRLVAAPAPHRRGAAA